MNKEIEDMDLGFLHELEIIFEGVPHAEYYHLA